MDTYTHTHKHTHRHREKNQAQNSGPIYMMVARIIFSLIKKRNNLHWSDSEYYVILAC